MKIKTIVVAISVHHDRFPPNKFYEENCFQIWGSAKKPDNLKIQSIQKLTYLCIINSRHFAVQTIKITPLIYTPLVCYTNKIK